MPTGWAHFLISGCATAVNIATATASTYTLGDADVGALISVEVSLHSIYRVRQ